VAVLNAADAVGDLLAEVVPAHASVLRYAVPSRGEPSSLCDAMALRVDVSWEGTTIVVRHGDGSPDVTLSVAAIGEIFAENALAAYLGARAAGVPTALVLAALARCPAPRGRFEVLARSPGVVVDYAHTPDALARTLTTARALARSHASGAGRVVVLFGAGGERDREKRPLMGEAAQLADRVVLTADNPRSEDPAAIAAAIREGLTAHADVRLIDDRADAIRESVFDLAAGDVLVIAGKGHEGVQELASGSRPFSDVREARAALDARRSRGDIVA
jgi:UDP-N-acetylmuramoyl-L-alanyl-D-glutamate--2,6-diaminopimelate ligase